MLVIGAGLLVRTLYNLTRTDAGFDRSRLVTFSMTLPMANSDPDTRAQAYQRVLDSIHSVPGVLGTAAMSGLPPNRTPDACTPIENYTSDDGRPLETPTIINSSWATISGLWASRSSPAAVSSERTMRREARWPLSMRLWRKGSGRARTRLASVCGLRLVRLVPPIMSGIR